MTQFVCLRGEKIVGMIQVRRELNDYLRNSSGIASRSSSISYSSTTARIPFTRRTTSANSSGVSDCGAGDAGRR